MDTISKPPGNHPERHVGSPPPWSRLTDREIQVFHCLPTRLSTREIGQRLNISPNTVKTHLRSIYGKLGVRSRNAAILSGSR